MGIEARIAQRVGHALDQHVGDGVLQPLGLVVHRVPGVAEEADQIGLDESVTAQHAKGDATARAVSNDSLVGHVLQQSLIGEPLDHPADRRSRKLKQLRDVAGGGRLSRAATVGRWP